MAQEDSFRRVVQRLETQFNEAPSAENPCLCQVPAPLCEITVDGCEEGIEYEATFNLLRLPPRCLS